jgi:hypothetical protein
VSGCERARLLSWPADIGYTVFRPDEREFQTPQRGAQRRSLAPLSGALHNARSSVAVVEIETSLQLRNESDAEIVVLIVGAPPEKCQAEHLPEVD